MLWQRATHFISTMIGSRGHQIQAVAPANHPVCYSFWPTPATWYIMCWFEVSLAHDTGGHLFQTHPRSEITQGILPRTPSCQILALLGNSKPPNNGEVVFSMDESCPVTWNSISQQQGPDQDQTSSVVVGCVQRWIFAKLKHIQKHHESLSICPYVFACSTTWLVVYPIIYTIQGSYISRRCRYLAINSSCILHNRTGRCRKSVQGLKCMTLYSDMTSQFVTSTIITYLKICNVVMW